MKIPKALATVSAAKINQPGHAESHVSTMNPNGNPKATKTRATEAAFDANERDGNWSFIVPHPLRGKSSAYRGKSYAPPPSKIDPTATPISSAEVICIDRTIVLRARPATARLPTVMAPSIVAGPPADPNKVQNIPHDCRNVAGCPRQKVVRRPRANRERRAAKTTRATPEERVGVSKIVAGSRDNARRVRLQFPPKRSRKPTCSGRSPPNFSGRDTGASPSQKFPEPARIKS